MPPRPAVHPSKKEAVFQLCNFLCTTSVEKLQDLADGKILLETIQAKFSLFSNDCPSTSSSEEIKASEIKVDFLHIKEESSDINSRNESEETKFNPAKEENDILLRYNNIQKFIDDHYEINSEIIISYDECRKSSELELIKVTIFVLSEIVKNLNDINNEHLRTLFHLDTKYQIELKDIFKVFITEREKLTRNEIETLLSKSAKNASPIVTPRRASSRRTSLKEQKSVSSLECSSAPNEDVFTNSPLKAYFESPIFKKEDILKKNKEIQDMQKLMYAEDEEKERRISEMEKELEKKDKDYKQLLKQNIQSLGQKDEEIELLKNSYEELSCKYQKLLRESDWLNKYHLDRIEELHSKLVEAEKTLEKKEELSIIEDIKSFSELPESVSESPPNTVEDALRVEVALLKDKIKNMELKIYTYKKQISEKLLAELKEKKPPENLNRSYEGIWNELYHERKGEEETAARFIQEDNRILSARLNEATSIIQNLNKEIEALKEQLSRKNRKSNPQKKVSSVATNTGIMNVPELPDSSKIPETEILRKSLSHSKNVEHYFDQSGESYNIIDESNNSVPYPCPKKSSEAVLWEGFDNPEIGSPCGINLSCDSFVPENSNLDVINDLRVNNIKIENVEPDILTNQENKYVLGNLNFDAFLNELKKITKNGSFQKVLQVFGKRQSEINGTNRPNRLDLQELLKMITECVCVAVSLNAESSFANVQDKCCSTDENELCSFNHNLEIDKLKNELQTTSQKYEIELKQYKMKLEELKKAKITMSYKCQAYEETIRQKSKAIEDLIRKFHEQKIKMENMSKKYIEHKDSISKLLVINKKERMARNAMKSKVTFMQEEKLHCDQLCKLLKEENNHLKQELHNLKVERNKLREKERQSIVSAYSRDAFPSRESCVGIPNNLSIKSELHSSTFQGTDNESVLSSAFHKNISHYVSENEDDFFDYNSLDSIKKEYEDDRVEELKRRNSLYPIHLQSSYPLEADLETTYASLYVKDGEKVKEEERCSKKRKVDGTADAEPSISSTVETPVSKPKKKMATPKSLQRFLRNIKYKNSLKMKPNGS